MKWGQSSLSTGFKAENLNTREREPRVDGEACKVAGE